VKRKPIKRRKRLEGQIEALASKDAGAAQELAQYGRNRSQLEQAVWLYLFGREVCQDERTYGKLDPVAKERTRYLAQSATALCELFLDAVDRRDGDALRTIARDVEGFERYPQEADPQRAGILSLKNILDQSGEKMTIARLAALLNRKFAGDPAIPFVRADGHKQLRDLATDLKFPIAPDKRGPRRIKEK
jgi:hypothetical protein